MKRAWLFVLLFSYGPGLCLGEDEVPRTILALYNGQNEETIFETRIHHIAEMPLNYLGLILEFHDINDPLPPLSEMGDVRGILTWFTSDAMPDPVQYLRWAEAAIDSGKKLVVLEDPSVGRDYGNRRTPIRAINRLFGKLGLRLEGEWTPITYDVRFVHKDPEMVEFERALVGVLPALERYSLTDPDSTSYLTVRRGGDRSTDSHLVVTNRNGGFAAPGYILYANEDFQKTQLYLNIFEFFRTAFDTDPLPKPDATTLAGRRIYYSHIDGDGWRNESEIEKYREQRIYASQVILDEVLKPYPDLPVTVAPIAGDIDPAWHGSPVFERIARAIFALPHVEAGTHTYSHPLHWGFFENGSFAQEKVLLRRAGDQAEKAQVSEHMHGHDIPRSYSLEPFSLQREVAGSIAYFNKLLPAGKRVEVLQWSGDTLPYAEALAATRAAGVWNINGGDTRLDGQFPSLAWVAPLGRRVGDNWQIYASNSNENTYTDLFTGKYFGFRDLIKTLENTEKPRRIKPINVYYHMYSGEKTASLGALIENLEFVRKQEITPITTSQYAAIADGFYTTRLLKQGETIWSIDNRGELQTIRFDGADALDVDFRSSRGVIGRRRHQGSLYVALDAAVPQPVLALGKADELPEPAQPVHIESRWHIWNLESKGGTLSFFARGFGAGEMSWKMPEPGSYRVQLSRGAMALHEETAQAGRGRLLSLDLPPVAVRPLTVKITRIGNRP